MRSTMNSEHVHLEVFVLCVPCETTPNIVEIPTTVQMKVEHMSTRTVMMEPHSELTSDSSDKPNLL